MISAVLEPFQYEYMRNAILAAIGIGALCGVLSCFLMLKGWSLIGDALSHSVVPGVVGAYMLGLPLALGAFLSGALAAGIMRYLEEETPLKSDVIIGVVFTTFFGAGLFVLSIYPLPISVQTITMGNILAIPPADLYQMTGMVALCLLVIGVMWRSFMLVFFDSVQAHVLGWSVWMYSTAFFGILAVAVVSAMQTVGALLVVAMVIVPGATMYICINRFERLMVGAGAMGALTAGIGAYLSFHLNGATGGVIILLQVGIFSIVFIANLFGWFRSETSQVLHVVSDD